MRTQQLQSHSILYIDEENGLVSLIIEQRIRFVRTSWTIRFQNKIDLG